jgi:hypothetical protein
MRNLPHDNLAGLRLKIGVKGVDGVAGGGITELREVTAERRVIDLIVHVLRRSYASPPYPALDKTDLRIGHGIGSRFIICHLSSILL